MSAVPEDSPPQPSPPGCCPFRPVHFLYAAVLLAWSIVTFGGWGLLFSVPVLGVWACVFASNSRPLSLFLMLCGVLFLLGFLLLPAMQATGPVPAHAECRNNLKQIGLALHQYHDTHRMFPPAYIADKNGLRYHSWRTMLLPYLDLMSPYKRIDVNKPWDNDVNKAWDNRENLELATMLPPIYHCPEDLCTDWRDYRYTSYVALLVLGQLGPAGREGEFAKSLTDLRIRFFSSRTTPQPFRGSSPAT